MYTITVHESFYKYIKYLYIIQCTACKSVKSLRNSDDTILLSQVVRYK